MSTPDTTYTPEPGGRYLVGADGKRVPVPEDAAQQAAPAPTPAPVAAPKPATTKE